MRTILCCGFLACFVTLAAGCPGKDDTGRADGASPDAVAADSGRPDGAAPETATPETATPDTAGHDTWPDAVQSDATPPDAALPDTPEHDTRVDVAVDAGPGPGPGDAPAPLDGGARDAVPADADGAGPDPTGQTSLERIAEARDAGRIDPETALIYEVFAVFGDPRLPAAYRGAPERHPADPVMAAVAARYGRLSAAGRATLAPFLIPPSYSRSWHTERRSGRAAPPPVPGEKADDDPLTELDLLPLCGEGRELGWQSVDCAHFRVWWFDDQFPEHAEMAARVAEELESRIWPEWVDGLGMRAPLPDTGATECSGPDERLDIYLVEDIDCLGLTVSYLLPADVPDLTCHPRPAFMMLDVASIGLDDPEVGYFTAAHELFHVIQVAYAAGLGCHPDADWFWLAEGTAMWAPADLLYPDLDLEHQDAAEYLQSISRPFYDTAMHPGFYYGTYLFPAMIHVMYEDRGFVRRAYEGAENQPDLFAALNAALPNGFAEVWPQFIVCSMNKDPFPCYRGDGLTASASAYEAGIAVGAGHPESQIVVDWVDLGLFDLTGRRYHIALHDDSVRAVTFKNPYYGIPNVGVYAILHFAAGEPEVREWTDKAEWHLCRDRRADRFTELDLFVENHDWQGRQPDDMAYPQQPLEIAFSDVGCWRWQGTVTSVHHLETADPLSEIYLEKDTTVQAEATFEYFEPPMAPPPGEDEGALFRLIEGTLALQVTQVSTTDQVCTTTAAWADIPIEAGHFHLRLTSAGGLLGHYSGWSSQTHYGPAVSTCSGETGMLLGTKWWSVDAEDRQHASADGTLLEGQNDDAFFDEIEGTTSSGTSHYEWRFTALREE